VNNSDLLKWKLGTQDLSAQQFRSKLRVLQLNFCRGMTWLLKKWYYRFSLSTKHLMKSDSLAIKVYTELRKRIISNQLIAGTRLKENDWATRLEVNRMAVREALNRLLGEHLVVAGERGGYFVKSLTAKDIREIRELREILELGALRLALQRMDQELISELEQICDDFTTMVQRGYLDGACEADVKFHETIIKGARNSKLADLYQVSNIPLFHQKLGKTQVHMEDYEQTDQEHRSVLKAIKEHDLDSALDTLIKHLVRGEVTSLEDDASM